MSAKSRKPNAVAAEQVKEPLPAPTQRRIHPTRFKLADQCRNVWAIVPERGTTFEQVSAPSYWSQVADRLRPADRIEVHSEEGSYYGELIVLAADQLTVRLGALLSVEFESESSEKLPDFFVSWRGPHYRHCVVRLKDGAILKSNFESKDAAMAWLAGNVKTLAA